MDMQPLLSDAQLAAIVGAIITVGGGLVGVLRWAAGRFVRALDDMAKGAVQTGKDLVELRSVVREGRDDIREIRDGLIALTSPSEQTGRRRERHQVATSPLGVRPIRRTAPDET